MSARFSRKIFRLQNEICQRLQLADAVSPLVGLRQGPDQVETLDGHPDRKTLRRQNHTWKLAISRKLAISPNPVVPNPVVPNPEEERRNRADVVRNKYPVFPSRQKENGLIVHCPQRFRFEVYSWLKTKQPPDNISVKIVVGPKGHLHPGGCTWFTACISPPGRASAEASNSFHFCCWLVSQASSIAWLSR